MSKPDFKPGSNAEAEFLLEHYNYDKPLRRIELVENYGITDVKWADYWYNITESIKENRDEVYFSTTENVPSSELVNLFQRIELREQGFVIDSGGTSKTVLSNKANGKKRFEIIDMGVLEKKAIYELLVELFLQLNVLEPLGHYNYKAAFDKENFDKFEELFKKYGNDNSYAHKRMIAWLKHYKETYLNGKKNKRPDYSR